MISNKTNPLAKVDRECGGRKPTGRGDIMRNSAQLCHASGSLEDESKNFAGCPMFAVNELLNLRVRQCADLVGSAAREDLALVWSSAEHQHSRADAEGAGHVMRDDDGGDADTARDFLR